MALRWRFLFTGALLLAAGCHAGEIPCSQRIGKGSVIVVRTEPGNVVQIDMPMGVRVVGAGPHAGASILYTGGETEYPVSYRTNLGSVALCAVLASSSNQVDRHIVLKGVSR